MAKTARRRRNREQEMGRALMTWAAAQSAAMRPLRLLFHVANEDGGNALHRQIMAGQGVKPGVPDYWLPYPSVHYHGLVFELKVPGKKPTPAQAEWLRALAGVGYAACYVSDVEDAIDLCLRHLRESEVMKDVGEDLLYVRRPG